MSNYASCLAKVHVVTEQPFLDRSNRINSNQEDILKYIMLMFTTGPKSSHLIKLKKTYQILKKDKNIFFELISRFPCTSLVSFVFK